MIDEDAEPIAVHTPIPVPIHWQDEVKAGLDRDVRLGVIEPVPVGEPVTWCYMMVVCAKKDGKPRRTVDFQPLNKHATRETHHTQSPFKQVRAIPENTKKTVLDAWNGYHSVPLDPRTGILPRSSHLGGGIAIAPHHKVTKLLEMDTHVGMMRSWLISQTRSRLSMTLSSGMKVLKTTSSKHANILTSVGEMVLQ